jgi:hypothetical protein
MEVSLQGDGISGTKEEYCLLNLSKRGQQSKQAATYLSLIK